MTDSEIGKLRRDDVVVDHSGRRWRVLGDAREELAALDNDPLGRLGKAAVLPNADGFRLERSDGDG